MAASLNFWGAVFQKFFQEVTKLDFNNKNNSDIANIVSELDKLNFYPNPEADFSGPASPAANNLISQYEQVVTKSLIQSFGLDPILFHDSKGGDVDTLITVRDNEIGFKNKNNSIAYETRSDYDSYAVHTDSNYININRKYSAQKKSGNLYDAYTGLKFSPNAKTDLDHIISAKEINDDPARILAELSTEELANTQYNLKMTDSSINRSKNKFSGSEFINKLDNTRDLRQARILELKNNISNLNDKQKAELNKLEKLESVDAQRLSKLDARSRKIYNAKLAQKYYTSNKFLRDTRNAALNSGVKLGMRQALGLILSEVWCAVREDMHIIMQNVKNFEIGEFLKSVAESFKKAFSRVKDKFKNLIASFRDGAIAGILSSITTTVINMFFATAKNIARILRESWASLCEAFKILFLNPDKLTWAERFKAVAKIIAVTASVILGGILQEIISKYGLPDFVAIFISSLVSGILSVTLIYFMDHGSIFKKLFDWLDGIFMNEFAKTLEFFKEVNKKLDEYLAQLAQIDYKAFAQEIIKIREINNKIYSAKNDYELNNVLHAVIKQRGIKLPYEDLAGLDKFMNDKNAVLVI